MTALNRVEFWAMNNPLRWAAQRHVEFPIFCRMLDEHAIDLRGRHLLDGGCGSGVGLELLARRFRPARLVGIDLMPEQVERARARGVSGAEVRVGDLTAIDAPAAAFDGVFVFGILHHIPEWRVALRELARVLKPGGVLLNEEIHGRAVRWLDRYTRTSHPRAAAFDWSEYRAGAAAAGFAVLAERAIVGWTAHAFLLRRT